MARDVYAEPPTDPATDPSGRGGITPTPASAETPPTSPHVHAEYISRDSPPTAPDFAMMDLARPEPYWPKWLGLVCVVLGAVMLASDLATVWHIAVAWALVAADSALLQAAYAASSVAALVLAVYLIFGGLQLRQHNPRSRSHLLRFAWMYAAVVGLSLPLTFISAQQQVAELGPLPGAAGEIIVIGGAVLGLAVELFLPLALAGWFHTRQAKDEVERWGQRDQAWVEMAAELQASRRARESANA